MRVRVKICGVTRAADASAAVEAGADAIGFNFVPGSPRAIAGEEAARIGRTLPPFVTQVGVFADAAPEDVARLVREVGLQVVQFHGEESPAACARCPVPWYKAFAAEAGLAADRVRSYGRELFLLDAHAAGRRGGTGQTFDWDIARRAASWGRVILAGGLTAVNVAAAIAAARPFAVDVCSGVERSPGIKDVALMQAFVEKVRQTS